MTKTCSKCHKTLLTSRFYSRPKSRMKDRLDAACIDCVKVYSKAHRESVKKRFGGLYGVYTAMLQRCFNKKCDVYKWYGARGISVCEEWRSSRSSFISWAQENGHKSGLWLDRINNDGHYEPSNCRFIKPISSAHNRRWGLSIEAATSMKGFLAAGMSRGDVARKFKVSYTTVWKMSSGQTWSEI